MINSNIISEVILVDETDKELGTMEKLEVHQKGLLHRAFSVFIFNKNGEFLLQRRADGKYHSGGLWSNTCCSHPRPGEDLLKEAKQRLHSEMGLDCNLIEVFNFTYHVKFSNGLIENEYDHVFLGITDKYPVIDESEVKEYKFINFKELSKDINSNPEKYTEWFKLSYSEASNYFYKKRTELISPMK